MFPEVFHRRGFLGWRISSPLINRHLILIQLQRYDGARQELLRAIECNKLFGHAAEPWKTWSVLEDLENAVRDESAAAQARAQAKAAYLAYRRDGGYAQPYFEDEFGITEEDLTSS